MYQTYMFEIVGEYESITGVVKLTNQQVYLLNFFDVVKYSAGIYKNRKHIIDSELDSFTMKISPINVLLEQIPNEFEENNEDILLNFINEIHIYQ